jgi:parallel beta-helix repeat protein
MKLLNLLLLFFFFTYQSTAQENIIKAGMKINRSVSIKKNNYAIASPKNQPLILVEGDNIILDFNDATIIGSAVNLKPDEFSGTAILIQNSKHVTIKNLHAKGFKIALQANNVQWLTLDNCDLSYNYRQHLNSTQEKEDISDWMSYHHNEKDEWLRYGAAIYLSSCNDAVIKECKVTGGQNALMMTNCNDGNIYNNDFSFNSGIGIGLYRSSNNRILHNRVIFNVRGYSDGVYNRGQDSAGMLVYEQSNGNLFYNNNVTHGGDGFFLWAGQTTMDNGKGGCNDNVLYQNDFSYAPTNGVEVTFSRNKIMENKIQECDHGIWGGYSFESVIAGNQFAGNRIAIAIEHGLHNDITKNTFSNDQEAIRLWARKEQPSDWGYAKFRDTRSAGYIISKNEFTNIPLVFSLNRTDTLNIYNNSFSGTIQKRYKSDSTVTNLDSSNSSRSNYLNNNIPALTLPDGEKAIDPFKETMQYAGRKNIIVGEWGPYDFRYPIIQHTNPTDTSLLMKFDLLGPAGSWKIKSAKGVKNISLQSGSFPSRITAEKITTAITDINIELEYIGAAFTDAFGKNAVANKPHSFSFKKFFQPIDWTVQFYALDTMVYNPIKEKTLFRPGTNALPLKTEKVNKLDYAWWGGIKTDKQYDQFITVSEATVDILPGNYELSVTWDDAVRVFIDDSLLINEWNPSLYQFDESPNKKINIKLGGKHHFKIEHLELGGFATLSVKLKKL